ncbi:MAG TPA: tagatose 1,6-diphosphate aldolase [Candidatus Eremiobacteraceae bacterium]|nr:tagatose 1,6-diphosphate aldolase [Candidatus Eremiobacteraceae bacterium]
MAPRTQSGKTKRLKAIADSRGVISALALDQRSALRKLFARAMRVEPENVPAERLVQFKEVVSRVLTPHASAILLDPEYGLAAAGQRARSAGLLLAYEKTGFDPTVPGRFPSLLDNWSAGRLVEAGADAIKLLLYYSSTTGAERNDRKHAFVERIGAECAGTDVPFFLELVAYAEGVEDHGCEFARIKPEVVAHAMAEFSKPRYHVDVLKVGVPVNMDFVEGSPSARQTILYSRQEAIAHYRRAAAGATVPFIYLSQGVSNETFLYALQLAAESGVNFSGVLCGRATWQEGVPAYVNHGVQGLEEWLLREGLKNIENVNRHLGSARSCFSEENRSTDNARTEMGVQP